jgi:AcrR family transcriptional regulator
MAHTATDTHEPEQPEQPGGPSVEPPDSRLAPEDGRVRRARELKVQTRAHIVAAIRKVFAERGFHGASMNELLVAAGVARGTFYLHFDSKEAAFRAVLDDLLERITASLRPVDTGSLPTARDQLVDNLARAFTLFVDEPDLGHLVLRQAGGISDDLSAHLEHFYAGIANLAGRSLRAGQALNLVRAGDVSQMARLALGLFKEAALMLVFAPSSDNTPRPHPEALAREVLDLVLHGVLVRPDPTHKTPTLAAPAKKSQP